MSGMVRGPIELPDLLHGFGSSRSTDGWRASPKYHSCLPIPTTTPPDLVSMQTLANLFMPFLQPALPVVIEAELILLHHPDK